MATLTVQNIVEAGLEASYAAADVAGDTFANPLGAHTFLHIKNGDASDMDVTIAALQSTYKDQFLGNLAKNDISVTVTAGEERFIGPIRAAAFGTAPDIQYSAVTSVTVAVIKV